MTYDHWKTTEPDPWPEGRPEDDEPEPDDYPEHDWADNAAKLCAPIGARPCTRERIARELRAAYARGLDHGRRGRPALVEIVRLEPQPKPKFDKTYCSHCHREFGPGDHGYSMCDEHEEIT